MRFEDLPRYETQSVQAVPWKRIDTGSIVKFEDLPQKRCAKTDFPAYMLRRTVVIYFADGTHSIGENMGDYWSVGCFGPIEEEVVFWREILT